MISFRSKLKSQTLVQFYVDFNKLFKEVKEIFLITTDAEEMQERWNKLIVLVFLRALRPEFSKAHPNVIGSSTVKSFKNTYYLCEVIPSESQNLVIVKT